MTLVDSPSEVCRYASWSPISEDDDLGTKALGRRRIRFRLALVACILLGLFWADVVFLSHIRFFTGCFMLVTAPLWIYAAHQQSQWPRSLAVLRDVPSAIGQYPVQLSFRLGDVVYGSDRGLISFVDGWLHYRGLATTFSLSPTDASVLNLPANTQGFGEKRMHRVRWNAEGVTYEIDIVAGDQIDRSRRGLMRELALAMDNWQHKKAVVEGHAFFPPKGPSVATVESLHRSAKRVMWGLAICASVFVAGIALAQTGSRGAFLWTELAMLAVGAALVLMFARSLIRRQLSLVSAVQAGPEAVQQFLKRTPILFRKL